MSGAPENTNSSLWALDQLRISLQRAAAMCQPAAAARAVAQTEESFDSADMEDVDSDEGVGVDERAVEISPEEFLQPEDEDWFSSARWVLNRQETREFIAAALLAHLAPLYVPYASIDARTPQQIVPEDVRIDIETFSDDFVLDSNLYSMSVQDVKDGVGAALGGSGIIFIPHEMPVYDDSTFESPAEQISALGAFGDKFEDTDDGWGTWYTIFQADLDVGDDDADDEAPNSDSDSDGENDDEGEAVAEAATGMYGMSSTATSTQEVKVDDDTVSGAACGHGSSEDEDVAAGAKSTQTQASSSFAAAIEQGGDARMLLREVVVAVLSEKVGLQALPGSSERAMRALEERLMLGKNARNALMLLKRITCHPLTPGQPLSLPAASQAALQMLIAGPLRSIRIETEDLPAAAVREAELFAARFLKRSGDKGSGGVVAAGAVGREEQVVVTTPKQVAEEMLREAMKDAEMAKGVSGWSLKFLFEGEAMEERERRRVAFAQVARELVHGPFAGVRVKEGEVGLAWAWDEGAGGANETLGDFAAAYGDCFQLAKGACMASVLVAFKESLRGAGFSLAAWCFVEQEGGGAEAEGKESSAGAKVTATSDDDGGCSSAAKGRGDKGAMMESGAAAAVHGSSVGGEGGIGNEGGSRESGVASGAADGSAAGKGRGDEGLGGNAGLPPLGALPPTPAFSVLPTPPSFSAAMATPKFDPPPPPPELSTTPLPVPPCVAPVGEKPAGSSPGRAQC